MQERFLRTNIQSHGYLGVFKHTGNYSKEKTKWKPLALQIMPDHVHFFISAPPKWAPAKIAQILKSWTSKDLREKFSIIRQTRPETDDFWASSYYCGTAGHISAETVARYIRENASEF